MPCYEVRTVSVEFKAEHKSLLLAAIQSLGLYADDMGHVLSLSNGIMLDLRNSRATMEESLQGQLNKLKQSYSQQVLKQACLVKGWQREFKGLNVNKMDLVKQY